MRRPEVSRHIWAGPDIAGQSGLPVDQPGDTDDTPTPAPTPTPTLLATCAAGRRIDAGQHWNLTANP